MSSASIVRTITVTFIAWAMPVVSAAQLPVTSKPPQPAPAAAPAAPRPRDVLSAEEIARRTLPSVFVLACENSTSGGFGSAFLVGPGVVATNYHVIKKMDRGFVVPAADFDLDVERDKPDESRWWVSDVLLIDENADLALLRVPALEREARPALPLVRNASEIAIGQKIYAVGNPEGLTGTISEGIVSSGIRTVEKGSFVQISAPISQGSSGGPVINQYGEVLGVAVMSLRAGQNLNFAVPAPVLAPMVDKVATRRLGAFAKASTLKYAWNVPASTVARAATPKPVASSRRPARATPAKPAPARPEPSQPAPPVAGGDSAPSFSNDTPTLQSYAVAGGPILSLAQLRDNADLLARNRFASSIWGLEIVALSRSSTGGYELEVVEKETGTRVARTRRGSFFFRTAYPYNDFAKKVAKLWAENRGKLVRFDFRMSTDGYAPYAEVTAVYWLDKEGKVIDWADSAEIPE